MDAVDTNVLVRFLVADDERQLAAARKLFARTVAAAERLFVSDVTLCELAWVLTSAYKLPRIRLVTVLTSLLHAEHLAFHDADVLARALHAFEQGKGDFADYVIREQGRVAGCKNLITFDKALLREPGFLLPV